MANTQAAQTGVFYLMESRGVTQLGPISNPGKNSLDWNEDPSNPFNWSTRRKAKQVLMIACAAFTTSLGVSIISPAHALLMEEFEVGSTIAILPLSLYVFALGIGSAAAAPLSEIFGRYPIYVGAVLLGSSFTLAAAYSRTISELCVFRFFAGFCFSPSLAVAAGTINETFLPAQRAVPSTIFILTPFLGPGLGLLVTRVGWRWTQWAILICACFTFVATLTARETFHPVIQRRRHKELNIPLPSSLLAAPNSGRRTAVVLLRPLSILLTEPIAALVCLYVGCEFATLFSLFAYCPLIFQKIYHFNIEESGLVFLAIVMGCLLGAVTVLLCDRILYRQKAASYGVRQVPPELRLYPSLVGGIGLPISLFWFGWSAREGISWVAPAAAIVVFAWGNMCVFVSSAQYIVDVYDDRTVASAMSANSLVRYSLGAIFPLFTIQLFSRLGIEWATSLFGFIALAFLPLPWLLFAKGERLRRGSEPESLKSQC